MLLAIEVAAVGAETYSLVAAAARTSKGARRME